MDVDGLRWEVRTRGSGPAAAADPRVHGPRDVAGPGTPTAFARSLPADRRRPAGPRAIRHAGRRPGPDQRRADGRRPRHDPAPPRRRARARPRLLARRPDRAAARHRPPRRRRRLVLESPSAGIADPAARDARRTADEALARGSSATGSPRSSPSGRPSRSSRPRPRSRLPAPPAFAASGSPTVRPASPRACGAPDRAPWSRSGTASRGFGADPRHRRRPRRRRPRRAPRPSPRHPGRPPRRRRWAGHTPHDERPAAFRRLALDFLQEDAA